MLPIFQSLYLKITGIPSPGYSTLPSSIGLCRYNIEDHGEYHDNISGFSPLSNCTIMTVDVIDNNHLRLHGPSSVIYLERIEN